MPQKGLWDYYSICKKKLDRLHAKKLNKSRTKNVENRLSIRKNDDNQLSTDRPTGSKNSTPIKQQQQPNPKLIIDSDTRQIILKSNTIIDQTKSPANNQNYCSNVKDDFIFKKPTSPAPRAKLKWNSEQKSFSDSKVNTRSPTDCKRFRSSILLESQQTIQNFVVPNASNHSPTTNENVDKSGGCKVRKRLFDSSLDDVKDKLTANSTDAFLNKLKDFQAKTSISNRFNISFYSPSKRLKEQQEEAAAKKDITNYSPQKYLENRLKSLSPKTASSIRTSNLFLTENSPPPKNAPSSSTYLSPQKASSNLLNSPSNKSSPFKSPLKSPFKSPSKSPMKSRTANELSLPDTYLELAKAFGHLDAIVIYLSRHSKICIFDKVKIGVQKLIKKEFDLKQLAQILTIYPTVYKLSYDPINENDCCLVIKPNAEIAELTKLKIHERFNEFKESLYRFARKVHSEYLRTLDRPIILKDDQQLKRWHPSFKFPDIPEASLPSTPVETKSASESNDEPIGSDDEIEVVFDETDE